MNSSLKFKERKIKGGKEVVCSDTYLEEHKEDVSRSMLSKLMKKISSSTSLSSLSKKNLLLLLVDEHHKEDVVQLDEDVLNLLVLCLPPHQPPPHPQDLLLYLLVQLEEDVINLLVLVVEEHHLHLCVLFQLIVLRLDEDLLVAARLLL